MGLSVRPKILLIKQEVTYAVDPTPTVGANAVLIGDDVKCTHDLRTIQRGNAKAWYGQDQKLSYGKTLGMTFACELAGAGVAGTAPPWAAALKACGFGELLLAAAHSGTAAAGAAQTITLAASASAVDSTYKNMTIRITGGTGSGQRNVIKSYVGATKVATMFDAWTTPPDVTSTYTIDANAVYAPISSTFTSVTIYFYFLGKLHKLLGARGTVDVSIKKGEKPTFNFTFVGLYGGVADSGAFATPTLTAWQTPLVVNNANSGNVKVHGYAGLLYEAMLNMAVQTPYRNVVGIEDILITDRQPSASVKIEDPLIATKDYFTIANNNTQGSVNVSHGTAAGNQVNLFLPRTGVDKYDYDSEDDQGIASLSLTVAPTLDNGNDEAIIQAY